MKWELYKQGSTSHVFINKKKGYVKKQFLSNVSINTFENEVRCLKLVSGNINFPKLISFDKDNKNIIMTYCGKTIYKGNLPKNWKIQVNNILNTLKEKMIAYSDFHLKNICVKGCTIYLIDFGAVSSNYSNLNNNELLLKLLNKV